MIVTLVYVHVKREHLDDFLHETEKNHQESVKEPGNLRFDILQDANDPYRLLLYEAYESEDAAGNHKKTPHYNAWRNAVELWMAEPRAGVRYNIIQPKDPGKW